MSKTVRDEAIEALKNKQSVVVNGKQYTLDNIGDLPPLEEFVAGDPTQEAEALAALKAEKAELEKRLAAFESKSHSSKDEKKATTKSADESDSK